MDSLTGKEIMELLYALNKHQGKTVICVTHAPIITPSEFIITVVLMSRITPRKIPRIPLIENNKICSGSNNMNFQ
ncbi:MAG: hypothetical protein ACXAEU_07305 [Candidatus Hodarchaeales archaeon]|jgi:ABC-type Mn2+/Zn2+ transport system ATPase subunit